MTQEEKRSICFMLRYETGCGMMEANIAIDKLIKDYVTRTAVVRYPRDIINIDEMLEIASIMISEEITYFTNDIYRTFIKRNNLIKELGLGVIFVKDNVSHMGHLIGAICGVVFGFYWI